jgi:SWI/SNF-related matrix-associated actin-dependent regulator 1 of chromatin subfamily A
MQSLIDPVDTEKGIDIWFEYPFSWAFVNVCRDYNLRWNKPRKMWCLKFNNATMPITSKRVINDYTKLFKFYDEAAITFFKLVYDSIVKLKNHKAEILTEKLDLSSYPELFQHQKVGIQFLQDCNGLAIIADEQGLGKTKLTALWVILQNFEKILIVTPCTAKSVWKNELITLGVPDKYISITRDTIKTPYTIINYDILKKFHKDIKKQKYNCVIFDEAHKINNTKSQRTNISQKISEDIPHVICVTGTPMNNRTSEIFPLLQIIKSPLGSNFTQFADRYCNRRLVSHGTGQHYDTSGASNLDELSEKLKVHMIRRLKKDCLDIPDKLHSVFKLDFNDAEQKIYTSIEEDLIKYIKIHGKKKINNTIAIAKINLLRQFCAEKKLLHTEEFIKDAIEAKEKILIFGFFNETLEFLYEKYKKIALIITGKTNKPGERESIEKQFQTDPDKLIFIGNIKAAGLALTLTSGCKVVFNDLTWNPSDHKQAEDRIHRIGTVKQPEIYYLLFRNSIEDYVFDLITKKQTMIDAVMNASEEHFANTSIINELLNKYEQL